MTTGYMSIEEHIDAARALLEESVQEYQESGPTLQSSEKLWGAACHALIARAKQQEWTVGSHRALVNASQLLTREQSDEWFRAAFLVAQKFHNRFYGDSHFDPFADTGSLENDREIATQFVHRVLTIVESEDRRNGASR